MKITRIISRLDIKGRNLVKGINLEGLRVLGKPEEFAREEGLALAEKYEGEFPKKYFNDFLDYVNITEENFWQVVDSWRSEHLWSFAGNQWTLNYPLK